METIEIFEQIPFVDKPRVDKETGTIYHAHVLGTKSDNGYDYALDGIKSAYTKYESMPVSIDHDYNSSPLKVDKAWATLTNPTCDDQGVWADLNYLKTHPLTEQILEDLERGTGLYSLSSVNGGVVQKGKTVTSFTPLRCDLVVKGATTKTLLEQEGLPLVETVEDKVEETKVEVKTVSYEQHVELLEQVTNLTKEIADLKARLVFHEQYITPKTTLVETITEVTKGIDLKKFWNEDK